MQQLLFKRADLESEMGLYPFLLNKECSSETLDSAWTALEITGFKPILDIVLRGPLALNFNNGQDV